MILIVLAIVLYMMFGNTSGGKSYMDTVKQTRDDGRKMVRDIKTDQMSMVIAIYRETSKKLPKTVEELESPGAFNDPWGKEMTFTFQEERGKTTVVYLSAGPDGEFKTADDKTYTDTLPY